MPSMGFFPEIIKKLINASQNHSISFNLWKDFLDTFPKNHQQTIKIWQKIMGEEDPLKQYDDLRRKFYIILNLLSTEELEKTSLSEVFTPEKIDTLERRPEISKKDIEQFIIQFTEFQTNIDDQSWRDLRI